MSENATVVCQHETSPKYEKKGSEDIPQAAALPGMEVSEPLSRFLLGVMHEFNNLHTAIFGYAKMLERQSGICPATMQMVREIQSTMERGADTAGMLMAFAREPAAPATQENPADIIRETMQSFKKRHADYDQHLAPTGSPLPPLVVNRVLFRHMIDNLLSNAMQAIEAEKVSCPSIVMHTHADKDFVYVTVSDNASRLHRKKLDRIFAPQSVNPMPPQGTGLALCSLVAELHGGGIRGQSTPGKGAKFTAYLPRGK